MCESTQLLGGSRGCSQVQQHMLNSSEAIYLAIILYELLHIHMNSAITKFTKAYALGESNAVRRFFMDSQLATSQPLVVYPKQQEVQGSLRHISNGTYLMLACTLWSNCAN